MTTALEDTDIIEYLRENPAFLKKNPEVCDFLLPPVNAEKGSNVSDFQSFMIQRLKDDKEEVIKTTQDIVETVRNNMNNQNRIHKAILRILEALSFDEFIQALTVDLTSILDVDITALIVEADGQIPHINTYGIRVVPEGTVDKWMEKRLVFLQENISGIEPIYGGGAALVRSQALVRIDISLDTPPAILAFGSRDPHLFQEGQGTEQIRYLAEVIERAFRLWLTSLSEAA